MSLSTEVNSVMSHRLVPLTQAYESSGGIGAQGNKSENFTKLRKKKPGGRSRLACLSPILLFNIDVLCQLDG